MLKLFKVDAEIYIKNYYVWNKCDSGYWCGGTIEGGAESDKFFDLRTVFIRFFEETRNGLGADLDVRSSVIFTMWDVFENHDFSSELKWSKPEGGTYTPRHVEELESTKLDVSYPKTYSALNCRLSFVLDSDEDYNGNMLLAALKQQTPTPLVRGVYIKQDKIKASVLSNRMMNNEFGYITYFCLDSKVELCTCLRDSKEFNEEKTHKELFCFYHEIKAMLLTKDPDTLQQYGLTIDSVEPSNTAFVHQYILANELPGFKEVYDFIIHQFENTAHNSYPCIITFEGSAGSGRSTLAKDIATHLKRIGYFGNHVLDKRNTRDCVFQPHYIETSAHLPLKPIGDCVVFINNAGEYIDFSLRESFLQFARECQKRCLIILSTTTREASNLLKADDTLRGMLSRRFTFKNYTIADEIHVLKWILEYVHDYKVSLCSEDWDMLTNLIQTAAQCSGTNTADPSKIVVGDRLNNGYFAARLAELLVYRRKTNNPNCGYISSAVIKSVCEQLLKDFQTTGVILTS